MSIPRRCPAAYPLHHPTKESIVSETAPTADVPTVPARVRTVAYFLGLATGALVLLATGIAPIWLAPDVADHVVSTAGVISGVAAFIAGGLGVAFRPTR